MLYFHAYQPFTIYTLCGWATEGCGKFFIITSLLAIYFFLWLLGDYVVIYDETYDVIYEVIYEVIMGKFRASMEPFWDLKTGKYVK